MSVMKMSIKKLMIFSKKEDGLIRMKQSDKKIVIDWLADVHIKAIREDTDIEAGSEEIYEFIQEAVGKLREIYIKDE